MGCFETPVSGFFAAYVLANLIGEERRVALSDRATQGPGTSRPVF